MTGDATDLTTAALPAPGEAFEVRPGRWISLARHEGAGSCAAATVFLVHGGGGNKNQWRYQWQALAGDGYHLVAWDLPGHGASPKPRDARIYDGAGLVDDLLSLIERYGTGRIALIGHSYGTRLILGALDALKRSDTLSRIERVALLGAPAHDFPLGAGLLKLPAFVLEWLKPILAKGFRDNAWHPETDPALIAHEEAVAAKNPLHVIKALMLRAPVIDAVRLHQLDLPVLILAGDWDRLTPAAGARRLADNLPDASVQVIAKCGHQIMLERPAETNDALRRFLETGRR